MRALVYPPLLALAMLCLADGQYTQVGDGRGTPTPDGWLRLAVGVDGAPRHAYVDKTKKTVRIWIGSGYGTNSATLFAHDYVLTGSDIQWKTQWSPSTDAVSVELYDWGHGVANYNNMHHMASSNHIALLRFVPDSATGKFIEKK